MKITTAEIESMLAASPGSTAETQADGFERRAARMAHKAGMARLGAQHDDKIAESDRVLALALRAYALQKGRAVYSLVAVAGGASFHGARFDDIQLPPVAGGGL